MNKIVLFAGLAVLLTFILTCQYPVDSSVLPDSKKFLIIDAELTENYGKVIVNYTLKGVTPQGAYLFSDPPQATAYVLDGKGNRTDFTTDGIADSTFHGVIGETYTLYVVADGNTYQSKPETMLACPAVDSVAAYYTRESSRLPSDLYYDGFDVFAYTNDIPGQENYYQWDWKHYERVFGCKIVIENEQEVWVPCTPYDCWGISYNTRVIVQSDKLRDGNQIAQRIVRVPFATPPNNYYLRVEQRAITASVFAYLQSVAIQTQNVGTLFDIPAQTVFNPNVYNIDDPTEQILGAFSVFSYRYKIIHIDMRQKIEGAEAKPIKNRLPFTADPLAQAPCTEGLYRTQKRPEEWKD
jgi:hypothetical protein